MQALCDYDLKETTLHSFLAHGFSAVGEGTA